MFCVASKDTPSSPHSFFLPDCGLFPVPNALLYNACELIGTHSEPGKQAGKGGNFRYAYFYFNLVLPPFTHQLQMFTRVNYSSLYLHTFSRLLIRESWLHTIPTLARQRWKAPCPRLRLRIHQSQRCTHLLRQSLSSHKMATTKSSTQCTTHRTRKRALSVSLIST